MLVTLRIVLQPSAILVFMLFVFEGKPWHNGKIACCNMKVTSSSDGNNLLAKCKRQAVYNR
uniref:Uncharacterized protein n=1 Tax=Rhizophora mucronata TaxID=61149 RepID=A0A2P2R184_RHIMU